jgi:drug/metabolite transporter (DMT)-like permease
LAPIGLVGHVAPTLMQWMSLFGIGALAFFAQYFMTEAYRFAPAHVVSPMAWFTVLWNTLQGIVFLNESLSWIQVLGFLLVALGVYVTTRLEKV